MKYVYFSLVKLTFLFLKRNELGSRTLKKKEISNKIYEFSWYYKSCI